MLAIKQSNYNTGRAVVCVGSVLVWFWAGHRGCLFTGMFG